MTKRPVSASAPPPGTTGTSAPPTVATLGRNWTGGFGFRLPSAQARRCPTAAGLQSVGQALGDAMDNTFLPELQPALYN
jgi:hypothetical protein